MDLSTDVGKKRYLLINVSLMKDEERDGIFATNRTGHYLRGLETVDRTWIMAGMATAEYADPSFLLARGCAISGIAVLG